MLTKVLSLPSKSLFLGQIKRYIRTSISDLRKGDWVIHEEKPSVVHSVASTCSARTARTFSLSLKCPATGSITSLKPSLNSMFDKMDLRDHTYLFMYAEEDKLIFSHPDTFENIEINNFLIEKEVIPFLEGGFPVRIRFNEESGKPVFVTIRNLVCTVSNLEESAYGLTATLASGEKIICPPGTKIGNKLTVDPNTRKCITV